MQETAVMNDPFVLLPANLGELARAAAREWHARPAISGVYLEVCEDEYAAVATDGRQLAIVRGRATADPLAFPPCEALAELPPSQECGVVPAADWREAFRAAPKGGEVAVHLGKNETVLCSAAGEEENARRPQAVEGKFPNYRAVLPTAEPTVRIDVNPDLLLNLLKIARHFADRDLPRVTLEIWSGEKPMVVKAQAAEQQFVGLLMPLTPVAEAT